MAITLGDIMRVRMFCRVPTQVALNSRHFRIENITGGPNTEQQLADVLSQTVGPVYKTLISGAATYYGLVLDRRVGLEFLPVASSKIQAGIGSGGNPPLPYQTTGMVTIQSVFPGRRGRGRMYLPFPAVAAVDIVDYKPTLAYKNNATTLADLVTGLDTLVMTAPAGTIQVQWGVWSETSVPTPTLHITSGFTVRSKWALLHKRGDYGKTNPDPF